MESHDLFWPCKTMCDLLVSIEEACQLNVRSYVRGTYTEPDTQSEIKDPLLHSNTKSVLRRREGKLRQRDREGE